MKRLVGGWIYGYLFGILKGKWVKGNGGWW